MKGKEHASTILNVDDDETSRYMINVTLRHSGFDVWDANTGQDAINLAHKQPDLILLDINLPDMNGFEVCRRLKNDPQTSAIPILHLSASRIDTDAAVQGLEGGADGYLTHPIDSTVLVATINSILRAKRAEIQWQTTFDSIRDGICLLSVDKKVLKYNKAFHEMLHIKNDLRNSDVDAFLQSSSKDFISGQSDQEFQIDGKWLDMNLHDVKNGVGEPNGFVLTLADITERKQAEETVRASLVEKEMLLQEIHHRVKNNLQVIVSLLGLQSQQVSDSQAKGVLEDSRERIKAMALIHENLYRDRDPAGVNLNAYLRTIASQIVSGYRLSKNIQLSYQGDQVGVDLNRAMPIGLILNELLTNSLKYAYDDVSRGILEVSLTKKDDTVELLVRDNGRGLESEAILANSKRLGWKLISLLTKQIDGRLEILWDRPGTNIRISFPP
jgi:PAS domain S-box-containing protein